MKRIEDTASAKFLLLDIKPGNMLARPYDAGHIDGTNTWDAISWGTATDIRQTDFGVGARGRVRRCVAGAALLNIPYICCADFAAFLPNFDEACSKLIMMTQLEGQFLSSHDTTGVSVMPRVPPNPRVRGDSSHWPLTHPSRSALLSDILTMADDSYDGGALTKCVTAIKLSTQASRPRTSSICRL